MKKSLLFLCISIFVENSLFSQTITCIDLPEDFKLSYQISSLVIQDEQVYLIAEKCKSIFILDKKTRQVSTTIDLSKQKAFENSELGLEGSALYDNKVFMIDEKQSKIFAYDINNDKIELINYHGIDLNKYKDDKSNVYGLEGIAINPHNKVLYVLREKNKSNQSEIYTFKIKNTSENLSLDYISTTLIPHNDNIWRYSDIYFDHKNKRLLCLKSNFVDKIKCSNNKYQIDSLSIDVNTGTVIQSSKKMLIDISSDICKYNELYSTNIEGITVDNGNIYIVSDNNMLEPDDCSHLVKKTLFLRLKL